MRIVARALIVTAGVVGFVGSTLAADMTGDEIKAFVSGKTGYLETTADSSTGKAGQGVIYWAADGTAPYKSSDGRHVARQVGNRRQFTVAQLVGEAEQSMRAS